MRKTLLAAALAAAACAKPAPPAPAPAPLQEALRELPASGPCARLIPLEWSASEAVPAGGADKGLYRAFFSGRAGRPGAGFRALQPGGSAAFWADGRVKECRRDPGEAAEIPGSSLAIPGMSGAQVEAAERGLALATPEVAALYWSAAPLDAAGRARVADFSRAFLQLANPAHAGAYRALNPDFWSWVERNGGAGPR